MFSLLIAQLWLLSAVPCPPIPISQTPGFLSKAISRQAKSGEIDFGSTYEVQIKEWHRSLDLPLKDVHSLLHPCASMPDGPADPVVCMAAERMTVSIDSKMTGCVSWGGGGGGGIGVYNWCGRSGLVGVY